MHCSHNSSSLHLIRSQYTANTLRTILSHFLRPSLHFMWFISVSRIIQFCHDLPSLHSIQSHQTHMTPHVMQSDLSYPTLSFILILSDPHLMQFCCPQSLLHIIWFPFPLLLLNIISSHHTQTSPHYIQGHCSDMHLFVYI